MRLWMGFASVGSSGRPGGGAGIDAAAFASLFSGASKGLWCIAAAIVRDRSLAHDIVQEAAVTALGKLDQFSPGTSFAAWMGQIVRYTALNELRRGKRARTTPVDPHTMVHARANEASTPEMDGMDPALQSALDTLEDTARTCLIMRTVMDMPYRNISAALGIPEGTAMSHVHRSRTALRSVLAEVKQ